MDKTQKDSGILEDTARGFRRSIEQAHDTATAAGRQMADNSRDSIKSQWSSMENYLTAVARNEIWTRVEKVAEFMAQSGERELPSDTDVIQAVQKVAKMLRDGLLNDEWAASSTSPCSNAADQTMRRQVSQWLYYRAPGADQALATTE